MILTCPECETQYFAEDSSIGDSGRTVKCATCGHTWFVSGETEQSSNVQRTVAHDAYRARLLERRRSLSRLAGTMAWAGTSAFIAAALLGVIIFRNEVVSVWPQSASAFRFAGMEVNRFQVEFVSAEPKRFFEGTTPILEIRGVVRNISGKAVKAPQVKVDLIDESGTVVSETFTQISLDRIEAFQTVEFRTRIEDPPYEAFELDLSFVPLVVSEATLQQEHRDAD
jgi:predicted Zn finger-like uncharacterized protein